MAFGDKLTKALQEKRFLSCDEKRTSAKAFWVVLRDIAIEDIKASSPRRINSDEAVATYFEILSDNETLIPRFMRETLPSNKQTRYRVANRNLFTSNAFHMDGLANQPYINAYKEDSEKSGQRTVYQWVAG